MEQHCRHLETLVSDTPGSCPDVLSIELVQHRLGRHILLDLFEFAGQEELYPGLPRPGLPDLLQEKA